MGVYLLMCLLKKDTRLYISVFAGGKSRANNVSTKLNIPAKTKRLRELVISTMSRGENATCMRKNSFTNETCAPTTILIESNTY